MLVTIGLQAEREFLGGEDTMGGLGSGGQRRAHRWVGSCAELNVHPLLARGCLEPGRSSTWTFSGVGAGDAPDTNPSENPIRIHQRIHQRFLLESTRESTRESY